MRLCFSVFAVLARKTFLNSNYKNGEKPDTKDLSTTSTVLVLVVFFFFLFFFLCLSVPWRGYFIDDFFLFAVLSILLFCRHVLHISFALVLVAVRYLCRGEWMDVFAMLVRNEIKKCSSISFIVNSFPKTRREAVQPLDDFYSLNNLFLVSVVVNECQELTSVRINKWENSMYQKMKKENGNECQKVTGCWINKWKLGRSPAE